MPHPTTNYKLQLKPRSARASDRSRQRQSSAKGNPFGAAVPREEILQKRGVDVKLVDSKYERKAAAAHFTPIQEKELEEVRAELEKASVALREANEQELPEEKYRVAEDAKRKELNALMEKFAAANLESPPEELLTEPRRYTSSRRHSDQQHARSYGRDDNHNKHQSGRYNNYYDKEEGAEGDPAFTSFSSNRRRHRSEEDQHAA